MCLPVDPWKRRGQGEVILQSRPLQKLAHPQRWQASLADLEPGHQVMTWRDDAVQKSGRRWVDAAKSTRCRGERKEKKQREYWYSHVTSPVRLGGGVADRAGRFSSMPMPWYHGTCRHAELQGASVKARIGSGGKVRTHQTHQTPASRVGGATSSAAATVGSTATSRGPRSLRGTSLTLSLLGGKLRLPPERNVVLVTAV